MKSNDQWEIFYLGCTPEIFRHSTRYIRPDIYQMHGLCTHSYVINRRLMEKMIGMKYTGMSIDRFYLNNRQAYGILPSLFYQRPDKSDIGSNNISSFRLKPYYHRFLDYYAMYINYPIYKLLIILSILFILLLILYLINSSNRLLSLIILLGIGIILMIVI